MIKKIMTIVSLSLFVLPSNAQVTIELLKDINPSGNSNSNHFIEYNDFLYFIADNGTEGFELWRTDGTEDGTVLFKDIKTDGSSFPNFFTLHNDKLYFTASTVEFGGELWVTDGTEENTEMVKDIRPGESGSSISSIYSDGDQLYFKARGEASNAELWVSEGTEVSTTLLKDINPDGSSNPGYFIAHADKIVFRANDGEHGNELWITDGTVVNTTMLKDIDAGSDGSIWTPFHKVIYNDLLYFAADNDSYGNELWVTDGTSEGTQLVVDINSTGSSDPRDFVIFNEKLFFSATSAEFGRELWVTDGTTEGTEMLLDIREGSGFYGNASPSGLTIIGDKLFFSASDGEEGESANNELWMTDGTAEGTNKVTEINPGNSSVPSSLFAYGNKLYFTAIDGTNGRELWTSDGTVDGTQKIVPDDAINYAPCDDTENFFIYQGSLYFAANFNSSGFEIWKITDPDFAVGISSSENMNFSIYPNPANNTLNITTDKAFETITIFDLSGCIVFSSTSQNKAVDISSLARGAYLIELKSDGHSSIQKFIKN